MVDTIARAISEIKTFTAALSAGDSTLVVMGEKAGGLIYVDSGTGVTLKFHVQADGKNAATTLHVLRDKDDADITVKVSSGKCYALPDDLFSAKAFKIVADTQITGKVIFKT